LKQAYPLSFQERRSIAHKTGSDPCNIAHYEAGILAALREEPIPNLFELHGTRAFIVIVTEIQALVSGGPKLSRARRRFEYRQIKPYWIERFAKVSTPFELRLLNGMNPPVPEVTVLIHRIRKERGSYGLHIKKVLGFKHMGQAKAKARIVNPGALILSPAL
jgi:hypothetical protein